MTTDHLTIRCASQAAHSGEAAVRTTLTLDDDIVRQIRKIVANSGKSTKAVVNDALRAGIANNRIVTAAKPYRMTPVSMGDVVGPYDLDKALQLAGHLEDGEIVRKRLASTRGDREQFAALVKNATQL